MQLYHDIIMDHYRTPRNKGVLTTPDIASRMHNPSCGDSVAICGLVKQGIIEQLLFDGTGCVLSQASASLLTTQVQGRSLDEISILDAETFIATIGIPVGPIRRKCVLLALDALKQAVADYTATLE
jgi:nitrogen fixation NifU-like protein